MLRCIFETFFGAASKTYDPFFSVSNYKIMTSENSVEIKKGNNDIYQLSKKGRVTQNLTLDNALPSLIQYFAFFCYQDLVNTVSCKLRTHLQNLLLDKAIY